MNLLDNLPAEVISLIVSELTRQPDSASTSVASATKNDVGISSVRSILCVLSLTCKVFNHESTRLLYGRMTDDDAHIQAGFLATIYNNEDLAALVRCYHTPSMNQYSIVKTSTQPEKGAKDYTLLSRWIRQSLLLMVNLKELVVRHMWNWDLETTILPAKPRGKAMPFQLHTFSFMLDNKIGSSNREEEGLKFLITQTEIKYLRWYPRTRSFPRGYAAKISNNIRKLDAPVQTAKLILPGRFVEEWKCIRYDHGDLRSMMDAEEFRALKVLSCMPSHTPESHTDTLSTLMGNTNTLRRLNTDPFPALEIVPFCGKAYGDFAHFQAGTSTFRFQIKVSEDPKVLRTLPRLKTLVMQLTDDSFLVGLTHTNIQETVSGILHRHPNIQQVYVYCRSSREHSREYRLWTRESSESCVGAF